MDAEATRMLHELVPFTGKLGFEVIHQAADEVRLRGAWKPEHTTTGESMHGGYVMAGIGVEIINRV